MLINMSTSSNDIIVCTPRLACIWLSILPQVNNPLFCFLHELLPHLNLLPCIRSMTPVPFPLTGLCSPFPNAPLILEPCTCPVDLVPDQIELFLPSVISCFGSKPIDPVNCASFLKLSKYMKIMCSHSSIHSLVLSVVAPP